MDKQTKQPAPTEPASWLVRALKKNYSGPWAGVALSALSAWLIVLGLKGLAGFPVNQQSALADLIGIVLVIGLARWFTPRGKSK